MKWSKRTLMAEQKAIKEFLEECRKEDEAAGVCFVPPGCLPWSEYAEGVERILKPDMSAGRPVPDMAAMLETLQKLDDQTGENGDTVVIDEHGENVMPDLSDVIQDMEAAAKKQKAGQFFLKEWYSPVSDFEEFFE